METIRLPERMFAVGEEPKGIRVSAYHKSRAISRVLNALEEEEVAFLRQSTFGKFIGLADKPVFSGRFARFLMSRQLKVNRPHEIWFLYAGRPIRFSLREFAIVTGLPCGKFPQKSKKKLKKIISESSNWSSLFGTLTSISVKSVISLLKKKLVTDKDTRIKYACLALLESVLLSTAHNPKIDPSHAEAIKDLNEFFAYPWGRVSFNLMMSSIKERDEVSLSQNTIAIKGFVHAIQLVMVEAVPAINEVVGNSECSSESDEEGEKEEQSAKVSISPAHCRDVHLAAVAEVDCIIGDDGDEVLDETTLSWSDDEEDERVSNMVELINSGHNWNNAMFSGGATKLDVVRMKEEAKKKKLEEAKKKKQEANSSPTVCGETIQGPSIVISDSQMQLIAEMVCTRLKDEINGMNEKLARSFGMMEEVKSAIREMESHITVAIGDKVKSLHDSVMASLARKNDLPDPTKYAGYGHATEADLQTPDHEVNHNGSTNIWHGAEETFIGSVVQEINDSQGNVELNGVSSMFGAGQKDSVSDVNKKRNRDDQFDDGFVHAMVHVATGKVSESGNVEKVSVATGKVSASDNVEKVSVATGKVSASDNVEKSGPGPDGLALVALGGVNQEEAVGDPVVDEMDTDDNGENGGVGEGEICRKSKRMKMVPAKFLVGDYQCDKRFVQQAVGLPSHVFGCDPNVNYTNKYLNLQEKLQVPGTINVYNIVTLTHKEFDELATRNLVLSPKLMDVLMCHTQVVFTHQYSAHLPARTLFLDSKFVSLLAKNYTKFVKVGKKESHKFQKSLLAYFNGDGFTQKSIDRVYCPFNFDQQHWVGVFIDCSTWSLQVLDCNSTLRTDASLKKEISTFASMFPYALKQACGNLTLKEPIPCAVERVKGISHNGVHSESAVMSVLLMQAHAIAGIDGCKGIDPQVVPAVAQKLAVTIYEENCGSL